MDSWTFLLSNRELSEDDVFSLIACIHSPNLGLVLLKEYYCRWIKTNSKELIIEVIRKTALSSLPNSILLDWIESLRLLWKDTSLIFDCVNAIRMYSISFVFLKYIFQ